MADIFREVDEDLRAENARKMWQKYGPYLVGLAALIVLASGAWAYWQQHQAERQAAFATRYAEAVQRAEAGDVDGAATVLTALAQDAGSGYATLARLYQAGLLAKKGDVDGALRLYDLVAGDNDAERLFRDLAILLAASHRVDREDQAALQQRLEPLLQESNPWRASARELAAVAALKAGKRDEAREAFARVADDATAPAGVRARAAEALAALGK